MKLLAVLAFMISFMIWKEVDGAQLRHIKPTDHLIAQHGGNQTQIKSQVRSTETDRQNGRRTRTMTHKRRKERKRQRGERRHREKHKLLEQQQQNQGTNANIVYITSIVGSIFFVCFLALVVWHLKETQKLCFKPNPRRRSTTSNAARNIPPRNRGRGFHLDLNPTNTLEGIGEDVNRAINVTNRVSLCEASDPEDLRRKNDNYGAENGGYDVTYAIKVNESHSSTSEEKETDNVPINNMKNLGSQNDRLRNSSLNISIETRTRITFTKSCEDIRTNYENVDEKKCLSCSWQNPQMGFFLGDSQSTGSDEGVLESQEVNTENEYLKTSQSIENELNVVSNQKTENKHPGPIGNSNNDSLDESLGESPAIIVTDDLMQNELTDMSVKTDDKHLEESRSHKNYHFETSDSKLNNGTVFQLGGDDDDDDEIDHGFGTVAIAKQNIESPDD